MVIEQPLDIWKKESLVVLERPYSIIYEVTLKQNVQQNWQRI